jgi:hypothetical protein
MTHYEEFAVSADLDGLARTVDAKSHWLERSFWVWRTAAMKRLLAVLKTIFSIYCKIS